jgi:hypothetical protein
VIDLARALRNVVATLEGNGVGYILVGSTAAASWGVVRATRDVDVVVVVQDRQLDTVITALQDTGLYVPIEDARRAGAAGGSFNVLDPNDGGKVDLFVTSPDDTFTASRLERRVRANVFDVPCWVATADDVVLAKLRWRRTSRSEVQWRDCIEIVATNDLDTAYLHRWAHELDITDDLEDLLRSARDANGAD